MYHSEQCSCPHAGFILNTLLSKLQMQATKLFEAMQVGLSLFIRCHVDCLHLALTGTGFLLCTTHGTRKNVYGMYTNTKVELGAQIIPLLALLLSMDLRVHQYRGCQPAPFPVGDLHIFVDSPLLSSQRRLFQPREAPGGLLSQLGHTLKLNGPDVLGAEGSRKGGGESN